MPAPLAASASDARLRDLFERALVGLYVSTPDGRLVACNEAFARLLGFRSVDDAIATRLEELYAPGDRDAFVDQVRHARRLDLHHTRLRAHDGRLVDVRELVVGEFDAGGALVELHGCLVDVTDGVKTEAALREREQQFRAVFYEAADAMLILDDRRAVVEANATAGTLFGCSPAALVGRTLDRLVADGEEPLAAAWSELLALGEAKREHQVASGTGTRIVECSYRARVQAGRHLCIARDITDRRLLEERVTQSEKIESIGRLAGGIAHDFNNLLTAILGYTELLINGRASDDPDRGDLEEIRRAGTRAAALTQQLLAFGRKQVLMPKEVDLNGIVQDLEAMLTRLIREDIRLVCVASPMPAFVRVDPTQIEQVILNLVLNARDALPGGGEIRIEVAHQRASDADIALEPASGPADCIRLRVADNGIGIPEAVRAHVFEPFFTTKEPGKGTGLGLASVYGIVRQSNGDISVESEEGKGTTFTMRFPAVAAPATDDTRHEERLEPAVSRETILLVEDEDAVRTITSAVLRRHGYRVFEAPAPPAAVEIFTQHGQEIDLLLTDVVMPEMNGPALAQRLVAARPELRVLFVSGYADTDMPIDERNPNISFLSKPFQAAVLVGKVRDVLARPKRTRGFPSDGRTA
ncbi:MAG: ATP-binding protein [Betaproteobacteria bacterium]